MWNSGIFFLERPINFLLATEFVSQFTLRVGEIKVGNGLRDCEELVNIVSAGEHFQRDIPSRRAILRNEFDDLCMSLINCYDVAIEQLIIIVERININTKDKQKKK